MTVVIWVGSQLPPIEDIAKLPRQPNITVLDKHGRILGSYGDFYGRPVQAENLPPHVIHMLLATEDRRFYHHIGIDFWGIVRAFLRNLQAGSVVQGGSTLTQQLAKNFLQSKKCFGVFDRSLRRKISEVLMALWLEYRFTKNQILTMYLNRVFWGARSYGLDAAALRYFGKHATDLTLEEAALLMGMLKGPSRFNPLSSPHRSEDRTEQVLQAAFQAGFITRETLLQALVNPANLDSGAQHNVGQYFTDWIVETLPTVVDVEKEDLIVTTTLSLPLQKIAEHQTRYVMEEMGPHWKCTNMALLAMTPQGAIEAMVGGVNYRYSKFNRVTQALRQPGSSFKYFLFLAALEQGKTPDSVMEDTPISLPGWSPSNFLYKSTTGTTTLTEALAWSVNAVAVRLSLWLGVSCVKNMSRRLGITTALPHNHTLALGSGLVTLLEITGAFATLAHNGWKARSYGILSVRTRKGVILYQHTAPKDPQPLLSQEVVEGMNSMMEAVVQRGTGRRAAIPGVVIRGKTGTTNRDRDSWFIAMTPNLVTGVWAGCDNEAPMVYHTGGSPSIHLWRAFMIKALAYAQDPTLPLENLLKNDALLPWGPHNVLFKKPLEDAAPPSGDNASSPPTPPQLTQEQKKKLMEKILQNSA